MPIVESESGALYVTSVDMAVTATMDAEVFISLSSRVNLSVTASMNGSVYFEGESEIGLAVAASMNGGLQGEPNIFGESEVDLAVSGSLAPSVLIAGNTAVDLAITATLAPYVTRPERFSIALSVDLLPNSLAGRSERRAILVVDGAEIAVREADWIEDEGMIDDHLIVTLADPADRILITEESVVSFHLQRKVGGVWQTTETLLQEGEVQRHTLEHGRRDGANADSFTFTGRTPLQVKFNTTPLTNLVLHDPQKLTVEAEDFDIIYDTNGNAYETEIVPIHRMTMADVFREIFVERCGFAQVHSDLPDEFIELPREDFQAGRPMIAKIHEVVGFFAADYQHINGKLWIKDGTAQHHASMPVRQVTIRGGKLKELAVDTEYERYDGVDLTYEERQLEYDFVTTRVDTPRPSTVDVAGWITETATQTTVRELRRNSQPERIIDEKIVRIDQTVHQGQGSPTTLIEQRTDMRTYDLYGNQIRRTVNVDARVPSLVDGVFGMYRVRNEQHESNYRAHPFELDKIYRYRDTQKVDGLIVVDAGNPMLGRAARMDMSNAYRGLNLNENQTTEFGPIEHIDEWVTPKRNEMVEIWRQRVNYINPFVANDFPELKAGDVALNTLVSIAKQQYVFERGVYTRTPDKLLPLDAGPIPLRFAVPCARRHLAMNRSLPKRVSATSIDFDETIVRGTAVNFRGRGGVDLGIYRIRSRRLSIRARAWSASYTAKQVGVSDQYILVDPEAPHVPADVVLRDNDVQTFIAAFECKAGQFLRCEAVPNILVEARAVGDTDWTDLEANPIDVTPYALTVQQFEFRLTTGVLTQAGREQFDIYVSL